MVLVVSAALTISRLSVAGICCCATLGKMVEVEGFAPTDVIAYQATAALRWLYFERGSWVRRTLILLLHMVDELGSVTRIRTSVFPLSGGRSSLLNYY